MNIAITSQGNTKGSKMDPRFGRAVWFAIYNPEDKELKFIDNPAKELDSGAGPKAAQVMVEQSVGKIISGHFGPKVKVVLEKMKIELVEIQDTNKTIEEMISLMK